MQHTIDESWIGREVVCSNGQILTIARLTKLYIVALDPKSKFEYKFSKKDLYQSGRSRFHWKYLKPDADVENQRRVNAHEALAAKAYIESTYIKKDAFIAAPDETLNQFFELCREINKNYKEKNSHA